MNKKIMSFVLAMCLFVGLGAVTKVLAYSYSNYGASFNAYYSGSTSTGSVTVSVGKADDLLGGNLTGVFQYYAGSLISYQGAGGQYQLYDSFGARFSATMAGEPAVWELTSVNFRTTDYIRMSQMADEYFEKNPDGSYKTEYSRTFQITKEEFEKLSAEDKKK